ncbi:hypothetical protein Poly30_05420 [Planctomycetes bacterium Poly30]|uniref:Peptidase M1 membrane alanine aminopeptidase domain-containing protein n=1 Tax=Saltatorellus ferox TaxID=2528018 RepID=A0A518ELS7_9BACT|nr:hypothetical protein Poly30_05420 [Planctomycetes bacterium Poly30]
MRLRLRSLVFPAALFCAPCIASAATQESGPESAGSAPAIEALDAMDAMDAQDPLGMADPLGMDDGRSSEADYLIHARIDDVDPSDVDDGPAKQLTGELTLTWKNRSGEAVSDLWFHLYLNAYANNRSLHLTESGGKLRDFDVDRGYGWQKIRSIRVDGQDLTESLRFRVPSQAAPLDRTLISVDLPAPVPSGEDVTVEIEWESRLPRVRRRTGTKGDFMLLSHWFPKLAVYERDRGWRAHPFHMNTEFYADYGTYDVSIDLPQEYEGKIAATGAQVGDPVVEAGRVTTRFVAPAEGDRGAVDPVAARGSRRDTLVHGFAFTADPDYVVYEKPFRWDEWAQKYAEEVSEVSRALGRTAEELKGRDVLVRVMIHPEHEDQAERHWRATAATLFFYGLWYGPYPYSELTAVDPAWGASAARGMEYPTIFTAGTAMFNPLGGGSPEGVTVHEAGHQFWYGLVGNNEPEAAWLDEGLNSFTDSETMFREYGTSRASTRYLRMPLWGTMPTEAPSSSGIAGLLSLQDVKVPNPVHYALQKAGVKVQDEFAWLVPSELHMRPLAPASPIAFWRDQPQFTLVEETTDPRWADRSGYLRDPNSDPIETKVWDYLDRTSYVVNSYSRTAVALRSLQGLVGRDAFLKGMRKFAEDWRYRHPYPEDFYTSFQEGAGLDLQWYFDEVFRGTDTLDWEVRVSQTQEPKSEGWFLCEDGSWTAECSPESLADAAAKAAQDAAEAEARSDDEDAPKVPYLYDVVLRRGGGLILPVSVRVTFDSGEQETFEWTREMQGEKRWWRLPLIPSPRKIESVIIDPDRKWFMDRNMSDNQWFAEPDQLAAARWGERALTRASGLLQWFMSIGG